MSIVQLEVYGIKILLHVSASEQDDFSTCSCTVWIRPHL